MTFKSVRHSIYGKGGSGEFVLYLIFLYTGATLVINGACNQMLFAAMSHQNACKEEHNNDKKRAC